MVSFLNLLPVETVNHITRYLGTRDANRSGKTCKGAYSIANPIVYKDHVPSKTKRGPVTWGVVTNQLRVIEMVVVAVADLTALDWLTCYQNELLSSCQTEFGIPGRYNGCNKLWPGDESRSEG